MLEARHLLLLLQDLVQEQLSVGKRMLRHEAAEGGVGHERGGPRRRLRRRCRRPEGAVRREQRLRLCKGGLTRTIETDLIN